MSLSRAVSQPSVLRRVLKVGATAFAVALVVVLVMV